MTSRRYFELASEVKKITDYFSVPLIIDDRVDICLAVNAAGVHIGDNDLPIELVRKLIGPNKILGVSAKSIERALEAQAAGADYLGVGAIYPTKTKVITQPTSMVTLKDIINHIQIPVVAIGGIKAENITSFASTGINGVAMVSEIMQATEIGKKVQIIIDKLNILDSQFEK